MVRTCRIWGTDAIQRWIGKITGNDMKTLSKKRPVRILLIEDDVIVAGTTKEILASLGYQVVAKRSSIQAWHIFRTDPNGFDLVITDLAMPDLSGDRLAGRIHRLRSEIPILLCTGYEREDCRDLLCTNVCSAILFKPFDLAELVACVSEALNLNGCHGDPSCKVSI